MASRMPERGEHRDAQTDGGQVETQQTGGGGLFGGNMFILLILILLLTQQGQSG